MLSVRKTKTASGAVAVQVVRYENRKVVVMKHVGSGRTRAEVAALMESASAWIMWHTKQQTLFPNTKPRALPLGTARYKGVTHALAYAVLQSIAKRCGFHALPEPLLLDLALMRIIEPTSKRRARVLLERYFGIHYAERSLYRALPKLKNEKVRAEEIAVAFAQNKLGADFALVLYDVTTLYFETFMADDLRVQGFSKDNKPQQPQIVVGLLVTKEGFPLSFEVFRGNTFEGKTMIPVLRKFALAHGVKTLTVVADAAMLGRTAIRELISLGFSCIVGARMGNCPLSLIKRASDALRKKDGANIRISTDYGDLVCGFSAKRFHKDKAEMERQIAKGKSLVARGEPGKRAKFVKRADQKDAYELDLSLIEKTKRLLGIKGYYTNVPEKQLSNKDVIARYYDLWHVEQAFRIAKSDLQTRPIFHHRRDAIQAHMVICFVALAIGKYLEIAAGMSLRHIVDILWSVTDARIVDTVTGEAFTLRSEPSKQVLVLLKKLCLSY